MSIVKASAILCLLFVSCAPSREAREIRKSAFGVFDADREFNAGSAIEDTILTTEQIENLALLAKVWGFLKYHHPAVVRGERHFDYDLFRVMPRVIAARNRATAVRVMDRWVASLGDVPDCEPCAQLPDSAATEPRLAWLDDEALLGRRLSARLRRIYVNRPATGSAFFVHFVPGVGNPDFSPEAPYMPDGFPDPGYRLLALFRFWNMVEYWSPYRDVAGENWDAVLRNAIPEVVAAMRRDDYALAIAAVFARLHDGHANVWSALDVLPPTGNRQVPIVVRWVEGRPVVTGRSHGKSGRASGVEVGDVIDAVDGVPVDTIVAHCRPWYGVSNEVALYNRVASVITRGDSARARLTIERGKHVLDLEVDRLPTNTLDLRMAGRHDHPGPAFRRLSPELAYLTLASVRRDSVSTYLEGLTGVKGLIVDIRDYPSDFMVFALGAHLVSRRTDFARFTRADPHNPGAFVWTPAICLRPVTPRIEAQVAVLVDESSMSQSEYTAMAFRAGGALIVGSTTAGADGDVSAVTLPGGLRGLMSGKGVFYPDRRPTQRVGIVPDVVVRPTIAGIRAGRDEVLEAAARQILKRPMSVVERRALGVR